MCLHPTARNRRIDFEAAAAATAVAVATDAIMAYEHVVFLNTICVHI